MMATENVLIATDCISDLPKEVVEKYDISTMYFYISTEEARFQDTFEMTSDNLIEYIEVDGKKAVSGCASEDEYMEYFKKLQKGTDREIVYICVSQKLSKAYDNAVAAASKLNNIHVVDSGHLSAGTGLMALVAAEMSKCGASAEMIIEEISGMSKRVSTSFIVNSTECLYRNGQISRFVYGACKMFSLHPILKMSDGRLRPAWVCIGKPQHFAKSYVKWVLKHKDDIVTDRAFFITSGCTYDFKEYVRKEIEDHVTWDNVITNAASATISCNCGSGAFGVLFMRKKECC